jgi:CheY-like chemotaxis protein
MHNFCILQVDDDENEIRLLQYAAQVANLSSCLRAVSSGQEAIDYIEGKGSYADRSQYPAPKVLLLDLRMPRLNGFDVLRWVRAQENLRGVVVIMFTASAHPDDIGQACDLGANAFVQKPSSHAELVSFLRQLKGFWHDFHQFPPDRFDRTIRELSKPELTP